MTPAVLRSIRGSAEQLLHRHAVTLSRDAASKEACANYASSEVLYSNALTLLETVLLDAKGQVGCVMMSPVLSHTHTFVSDGFLYHFMNKFFMSVGMYMIWVLLIHFGHPLTNFRKRPASMHCLRPCASGTVLLPKRAPAKTGTSRHGRRWP